MLVSFKINKLKMSLEKFPDLCKEWHPTKNKDLKPSFFTFGSGKKVWWLCPNKCNYCCLHEYEQTIVNKKNSSGCPFCSPNPTKICYHKSLEFLFPEILKECH